MIKKTKKVNKVKKIPENAKDKEIDSNKTLETSYKENLKQYLNKKMPVMFDRNPNITGNLNQMVDEILQLLDLI